MALVWLSKMLRRISSAERMVTSESSLLPSVGFTSAMSTDRSLPENEQRSIYDGVALNGMWNYAQLDNTRVTIELMCLDSKCYLQMTGSTFSWRNI